MSARPGKPAFLRRRSKQQRNCRRGQVVCFQRRNNRSGRYGRKDTNCRVPAGTHRRDEPDSGRFHPFVNRGLPRATVEASGCRQFSGCHLAGRDRLRQRSITDKRPYKLQRSGIETPRAFLIIHFRITAQFRRIARRSEVNQAPPVKPMLRPHPSGRCGPDVLRAAWKRVSILASRSASLPGRQPGQNGLAVCGRKVLQPIAPGDTFGQTAQISAIGRVLAAASTLTSGKTASRVGRGQLHAARV